MNYKEYVITACNVSRKQDCHASTLRNVYNHFVDYMYESKCHSRGMFESYGVVLDFKAVEDNIVKAFCDADLKVIILCLRQETYTPLALVLASYIENRCRVKPEHSCEKPLDKPVPVL